MVLDSRQLKPAKYLAAMQQPANLPMNAEKMIMMVYAHVIPRTKIQKENSYRNTRHTIIQQAKIS